MKLEQRAPGRCMRFPARLEAFAYEEESSSEDASPGF